MNVRPFGESAVLVELDPDRSAAAMRGRLADRPGIGAVVPGACTLLVEYDSSQWTPDAIVDALGAPDPGPQPAPTTVEIPVHYDGADLDDVARFTGIEPGEVIRRHQAPTYTVAFVGFAPGFAYLTGLDPALAVPRLDEPRTDVPAGSVAVAGEFSAVYPRRSPGGWRLLGHTDLELWNIERVPPALLVPGTSVRFVAT